MTVLLSIGGVDLDHSEWAIRGWPRFSYQRTLSEFELANGDYAVRFRGRRAPTVTITMSHAPGQPFDSDELFSASPRTAPGQSWHSVVASVIALTDLVDAEPVLVSIGDLELGSWWVESVEPSSDEAIIAGGVRGGYAPTLLDVTIRLRGHRDGVADHASSGDISLALELLVLGI